MNKETLRTVLDQIRVITDDNFVMSSDIYLLHQFIIKQLNEKQDNKSVRDRSTSKSSKSKLRRKRKSRNWWYT